MDLSFSVSKEDLLRSTLLKPGAYVLLIKNITQGPGKNDPQSTTTTVDFVTESGPDPNAAKGVPITYWISEKAAGLAAEFLEAAFGKKLPEDGATLSLSNLIGRKIKAYIKQDKWQGRGVNKIDGFMPMSQ